MCDGVKDCPAAEDEKKCAALIDDDSIVYDNDSESSTEHINEEQDTSRSNKNDSKLNHVTKDSNKKIDSDQEAYETSVLETNTFRAIINDEAKIDKLENSKFFTDTNESLFENPVMGNTDSPVIAGREIPMTSKHGFVSSNAFATDAKTGDLIIKKEELNSYHNKGYLSVRKNGMWGKLCLSDMNNLIKEHQASWSIQDLGRAICKAITYQ